MPYWSYNGLSYGMSKAVGKRDWPMRSSLFVVGLRS